MLRNLNVVSGPVAHVRFQGNSQDIALANLGIATAAADADIRLALARFLEVDPSTLDGHVIDRHPSGNLTLRPEAVFG